MKKVLIVTYYWPPSGGAGVQRWLKFVKYLDRFHYHPIVFTPENPERPVIDKSLSKDVPDGVEVIKLPIWEPYDFYRRFLGLSKEEKVSTGFLTEKKARPGLLQKLSVWIRGNCFIPDARVFWVKPAIRYLKGYLDSSGVRNIITTGPPHSMHLIGLGLKECYDDLNWIVDFRDPWTNIDYYKDLMLTGRSDKRHHDLEQKVVSHADSVIVVGKDIAEDFEKRYNVSCNVVTNGYDEDEFSDRLKPDSDKLYITHLGTLVKSRNPVALYRAIELLKQRDAEISNKLVIRFVGKTDVTVKQEISERGLDEIIEYIEYIPHDDVPATLMRSSLLLLVINDTPNSKGILTGKLFEYMASRRPIICLGPSDGDAAQVIDETESGVVFENDQYSELADFIEEQVNANDESGGIEQTKGEIKKYSRSQQAMELISLIESVN